MVELLSVLALATKQINEGRFSTSVLAYNYSLLTCDREIYKEVVWRKGDRVGVTEARQTHPRRVEDDRCSDS